MVDYVRLEDLGLLEVDQALVRKFMKNIFWKYDIPDEEAKAKFSRASTGISPATKLFMFVDSIYPFFIKVGKKEEIEKESRKYGQAVVRIPPLNIPPKEDFILGATKDPEGGERALIAFRYVTGRLRDDPPQSMFEAYKGLSGYQLTEIIDELFQAVLANLHKFHAVKAFSPVEHLVFDEEWVATAKYQDIDRMVGLYAQYSTPQGSELLPHGLVHGDLHLNNIFLGRGNSPVVFDFAMLREDACLVSDFAEFEVALLVCALRHDYNQVSQVTNDCFS